MNSVTLKAYGKLNLSLGITGTRADGYHLLDMVMQSVSVYDVVEITLANTDTITLTCSDATLLTDGGNLAYKACQLFAKHCPKADVGMALHIEKHIPHGAGMGGASADAAAVLVGLNQLYGAPFSMAQLQQMGLQLGADVPFCLQGGTARVRGIGEVLTPLPAIDNLSFVILKPAERVSTALAYAQYDKLENPPKKVNNHALATALQTGDWEGAYPHMQNELEAATALKGLHRMKTALLAQGAKAALMTGSGACVFGVFPEITGAKACEKALQSQGLQAFLGTPVAQGVQVVV